MSGIMARIDPDLKRAIKDLQQSLELPSFRIASKELAKRYKDGI